MTSEKWPLVLMSVGLIVGAVIDGWKFKVPNWLTFPLIFAGWFLGLMYWNDAPFLADTSNRFFASFVGTFVSFLLLYWMSAINMMGAGDVKLLMGFGAWMGAYFGTMYGGWLIVYSYFCGVIIGGVISLLMMLPRPSHHKAMMKEVLTDIAQSKGSLANIAEKAGARKSRMTLIPYGVPLTIGFVGYVWLREFSLLPAFLDPYP